MTKPFDESWANLPPPRASADPDEIDDDVDDDIVDDEGDDIEQPDEGSEIDHPPGGRPAP
jgi:hypothetical protein